MRLFVYYLRSLFFSEIVSAVLKINKQANNTMNGNACVSAISESKEREREEIQIFTPHYIVHLRMYRK